MTATGTMLALPSGGPARPRHLLSVAVLVAGAAELMTVLALVAAYLNVRALAIQWPPKGVHLDNYLGTVLLVTVVLSTITAEWAAYALKLDNRRQSLTALAMTLGFGAAFLNLLWYVGVQLKFGPADHSYAVVVYALLIVMGAIAAIGLGVLIVALVRTLGGQSTARDPELTRAAAWHWHVVTLGWVFTFTALYVLQHR